MAKAAGLRPGATDIWVNDMQEIEALRPLVGM